MVHMNSNPVAASSNSGVLTLNSLQLRVVARRNPVLEPEILSIYNSHTTLLTFTYPHIFSKTMTLTAAQNNDILLSSLIGHCAMMALMIRQPNSTNASNGQTTFTALSGTDTQETTGYIDLLDNTKQTLLGSGAVPGKWSRCELFGLHQGGTLSSYQPIYWLVWADHPISQRVSGVMNGYITLNSEQYLRITPSSTFTSGQYTITILAYMFSALSQVKGILQNRISTSHHS